MTKVLVFVMSTGLSAAAFGAAQQPLYAPVPKTHPTKGSKETLQADEGVPRSQAAHCETALGRPVSA